MGRTNWRLVFLGGLLAGIVMNILGFLAHNLSKETLESCVESLKSPISGNDWISNILGGFLPHLRNSGGLAVFSHPASIWFGTANSIPRRIYVLDPERIVFYHHVGFLWTVSRQPACD